MYYAQYRNCNADYSLLLARIKKWLIKKILSSCCMILLHVKNSYKNVGNICWELVMYLFVCYSYYLILYKLIANSHLKKRFFLIILNCIYYFVHWKIYLYIWEIFGPEYYLPGISSCQTKELVKFKTSKRILITIIFRSTTSKGLRINYLVFPLLQVVWSHQLTFTRLISYDRIILI